MINPIKLPFLILEMLTFYGGGKGGGSAPAPDPAIGQAQLKMANLADQEYQNWQTQVWPALQTQMQQQQALATKTSDADIATQQQQQQIAAEEEAQVKKNLYPIQDQITQQAQNFNTPGYVEQQSARAMGDVRSAFDQARNTQALQMKSYGVDPTSGQFQGMWNANQVGEAAAEAAAGTRARDAAVQLGWGRMLDAANVNAGLPAQQTSNAVASTGAGTSAVNVGQVPVQNTLASGSSMAQATGIPINAYGTIGQLGAQQYQTQVNAWNAQQQANAQSSAGWGQALGTAAGIALAPYTGGSSLALTGASMAAGYGRRGQAAPAETGQGSVV